jgi:hypothetical protein
MTPDEERLLERITLALEEISATLENIENKFASIVHHDPLTGYYLKTSSGEWYKINWILKIKTKNGNILAIGFVVKLQIWLSWLPILHFFTKISISIYANNVCKSYKDIMALNTSGKNFKSYEMQILFASFMDSYT